MATRAPSWLPLIPAQLSAFLDPVPASPSHPLLADAKQHSLATSGRNMGMTVGIYVDVPASGSDTYYFSIRVPPGVQYMKVGVLISGLGYCSIDSTNNGNPKSLGTSFDAGGDVPAAALFFSTSEQPNDDLSHSPLKVRASLAWDWTYETVTFIVAKSVDYEATATIHGVVFTPIWQPQTV